MGEVSSALFNKQRDQEGLCGVVLEATLSSQSGVKATPLLQEGLPLACLGHIYPPWWWVSTKSFLLSLYAFVLSQHLNMAEPSFSGKTWQIPFEEQRDQSKRMTGQAMLCSHREETPVGIPTEHKALCFPRWMCCCNRRGEPLQCGPLPSKVFKRTLPFVGCLMPISLYLTLLTWNFALWDALACQLCLC